jgi:hypothetical protein
MAYHFSRERSQRWSSALRDASVSLILLFSVPYHALLGHSTSSTGRAARRLRWWHERLCSVFDSHEGPGVLFSGYLPLFDNRRS